ncbi:hypothetical protein [Trinickia symbiotica]|nr:hypothetical protein [Trinickia symbiotica]
MIGTLLRKSDSRENHNRAKAILSEMLEGLPLFCTRWLAGQAQ